MILYYDGTVTVDGCEANRSNLVTAADGGMGRNEQDQGPGFSLFSPFKSINDNYLINKVFYQKYFCVRTFADAKCNFVPKGIPIG